MCAIQILFNVIGGLVTVVVIEAGRWLRRLTHRRHFKELFGQDIFRREGFHLVYTSFILDESILPRKPDGTLEKHVYQKTERPGLGFSIDEPVSSAEVRPIKYLAEVIGAESRQMPSLSTDYDLEGQFDISFAAFGSGASNTKTQEALENKGNEFAVLTQDWFADRQGNIIPGHPDPRFYYGLILKIHPMYPTQLRKRTWLVCAGHGEWGTSGAARYLAENWKDIHELVGAKPFAFIVKVKPKLDESAELAQYRVQGGPWVLF